MIQADGHRRIEYGPPNDAAAWSSRVERTAVCSTPVDVLDFTHGRSTNRLALGIIGG